MDRHPRFWLYVYSTPNIVGSLLGILGLLLFFSGLIDRFWFLIVVGLYGIGALATPRSPTYELSFKNQLTVEDIRAELDGLLRKVQGRIPADALALVKSIQSSILSVLPQMVDLSGSDHNIYLIKQTALDYLPTSLQAYLNLPPAYATLRPIKDGKTARQLLVEQLTLLDDEMKEIVQAVYANDSQALMVQGRFLQDKFQKSFLG